MTELQNTGCLPGGQQSPCSFEAGQNPAEFPGIVSSVRSVQQADAGIFTAVIYESDQTLLTKEFVPQILLFDLDETPPIYLLNQSLLC